MRRFMLALFLLFLICGVAQAGMVFYEQGDMKIAVEDATACILYDFKAGETHSGAKVSLVQYKKFNLDVGCIGDYDRLNYDAFVGLSIDVNGFEFNENIYTNCGVFGSPGWIDDSVARYGVYGGITVEF